MGWWWWWWWWGGGGKGLMLEYLVCVTLILSSFIHSFIHSWWFCFWSLWREEKRRREEKRGERIASLKEEVDSFIIFSIVNLSWQDFSSFTGLGLNRVQSIVCNFMYWNNFLNLCNKGCVTLWPCWPFYIKKYLKAKEELWKLELNTLILSMSIFLKTIYIKGVYKKVEY